MERSTHFSRLLMAVFVCALVQSRPAEAQDKSNRHPRVGAGFALGASFYDKNNGVILYGNGNTAIYEQRGTEFCTGVQVKFNLGKNQKWQLYVQPTVAGGPVQTSVQFPVNGVDLEELSKVGADARFFVVAGIRPSNPKNGFGFSLGLNPASLRTLPNNRIMGALGSNTKGFAGVSSIEPPTQVVLMVEKGFPLAKGGTLCVSAGAGLLPTTFTHLSAGTDPGFGERVGNVFGGVRVELPHWQTHRDKK